MTLFDRHLNKKALAFCILFVAEVNAQQQSDSNNEVCLTHFALSFSTSFTIGFLAMATFFPRAFEEGVNTFFKSCKLRETIIDNS